MELVDGVEPVERMEPVDEIEVVEKRAVAEGLVNQRLNYLSYTSS